MDEMSSAVRCLFALGVLAFGAAACSALISLDGYSSGAGAGAADGAAEASSDAVGIPDDGGTADAALDAPPLSYVAEVLADLPAAYWRFGEDGGTTATDQRGTHPGSYVGDVQLGVAGAIRGDSDTAIALDGGSVAFGDVFGFEGRAAFTVEAWAKPAVVDLSYRNIYSKITDGEPRSGHFMWVHATDGVAFERNLDFVDAPPAGVQDGVGGHTPLQVGAWSQMVATYDGTAMAIYINGRLYDQGSSTISLPATGTPFVVGSGQFVGGYFLGAIDEVAVYTRALPEARIAAHYHAAGY
jgi:hypothetical protein